MNMGAVFPVRGPDFSTNVCKYVLTQFHVFAARIEKMIYLEFGTR